MSSSKQKLLTPLSAAIAAALYPGQDAKAQDQNDDYEMTIEEVIVTAQRREVSMQDLPQSIQAFTNEDIARNAFTNFIDVANAIPSLTLIQDMPGRNSVKFRGVSTGTGEYYTASTSAIYFDETPLTFNSQQLWPALVDIQHIESLPGPQGTLFGSSSLAGTVRIITNKPDPSGGWSGEVFGDFYGTDGGSGSWALNGWVNIPLVEDKLALRLVAHTRDEGGWIDNVRTRAYARPNPRFPSGEGVQSSFTNADVVQSDWNEYALSGGRATLLWNITDNWTTTLGFISESNEADGSWAENPYYGDNNIALFHKEFRDDEWWNASLLIEGDLGFATLVSSTTFVDREITYEWDNMIYEQYKDSYWGYYWDSYYWWYGSYVSDYTYGWIFNDQTQERFSQEIRLTSQSDSRFQWMVGGFYEDIEDKWDYGSYNPDFQQTTAWYYSQYLAYYYSYVYPYDWVEYPLPPTNVPYRNILDRTNEQLAFFGEISFDFTENWSATAGARWFQFKQDNFDQNFWPATGLAPFGGYDTAGIHVSNTKTDDWAFKLSTQYNFTDDIMAYALFSQGFRNGGENSLRAASTGVVPLTYEPDYLDNYEIGVKSILLDGSLQLNFTIFRMEWNDRQFNEYGTDDLPWWVNGNVNATNTVTDGFELSGAWNITPRFSVEGSVTHLDAGADGRYVFADGTIMRPGDPLPNAPEWAYWLALDYTLPWTPWDSTMWTRLDYSYGDEWWSSTNGAINRDPNALRPSWNTTNLQLAMALPGEWTLTAYVNNVTNEKRVTSVTRENTESNWFGDERFRTLEYQVRPRHYGISVRKRFN